MQDASKILIDELRRGSIAAFEQVYLSEKNRVFGFLLRLCGDSNVAADLFQNVWLKLARHAPRLQDGTHVRAWLLTVARREYLSYRRAQIVDLSRFLAWGRQAEAAASSFAPSGEVYEIEVALEALSEADREVLLLAAVDGLESAAAATALGITPTAWRQRLSRARGRLADQLELAQIPRHSVATPRRAQP